jgi:hypothetical protein
VSRGGPVATGRSVGKRNYLAAPHETAPLPGSAFGRESFRHVESGSLRDGLDERRDATHVIVPGGPDGAVGPALINWRQVYPLPLGSIDGSGPLRPAPYTTKATVSSMKLGGHEPIGGAAEAVPVAVMKAAPSMAATVARARVRMVESSPLGDALRVQDS